MRANKLIRVIILIFLLSAVFVSAVGCENTPSDKLPSDTESGEQNSSQPEQDTPSDKLPSDTESGGKNSSQPEQDTPSDTELAMAKKWENIIVNADADIRSLDIKSYTIQPAYSSITTKVQVLTVEESNFIEEFLNIVREMDVSFEDFEFDEDGITEFYSSHIGKQVIEIMLKDSNETDIFGLCLYENGDIDIIEAREVTETKKTYRHIYRVYFEDSNTDVFAAIESFYNNSLTE